VGNGQINVKYSNRNHKLSSEQECDWNDWLNSPECDSIKSEEIQSIPLIEEFPNVM
jgi:hypothetical protein